MKFKTGCDEFCLHCMQWREYDEIGRCKICKHIIYRENKKSEKEGYNYLKYKSTILGEFDEYIDNFNY
jgi:uncharacterized paraquat-inducible protein A